MQFCVNYQNFNTSYITRRNLYFNTRFAALISWLKLVMVEINEETTEPSPGPSPSGSSEPQTTPFQRMIAHMTEKKIETVLWLLRMVTLIFGLLYVLPIGVNQFSCYQRALIAGAATHALRLHQRLGGFRFSMEFLQQVFTEDACHYLFYCVLFLGVHPITMALMPVYLFAMLHWASFTIQLLNIANMSNSILWRVLNRLVAQYSQTCLQIIACCEIFLMPMVIFMIFSGKSNILIPFVYYRFLTLRYLSRRNPNTRQTFTQMRYALEQSVNRPGCPQMLRNTAYKVISLVSRLAPQQVVQQQQ